MKLLVIGNCQARPLSALFSGAVEGVEPLEPVILHLAKEQEAETHFARMQEADLILTQATAASFKPAHLVSADVQARFPGKTRIWPNIFYAGQQPNLKYLTHTTRGRIYGPLDIYHDCDILRAWYLDRLGIDPVPPAEDPEAVHARSIQALRNRESECDVTVSDLIEAHRGERRLFFTFNHPARWLLERMTERLCALQGLVYAPSAPSGREPLGRIAPPSVFDDGETLYQGLPVGSAGPPRRYMPAELRSTAFACYDAQREVLTEIERLRYTPRT